MKISILSDTHNLLRPQVLEAIRGSDAILHGGDISSLMILEQLEKVAPVYAVRGNNDKEWAEQIPHDRTVTLGGVRFYLVHKKKEIPSELSGVDVVIYGHSHKYEEHWNDGIYYLNPGSCGPRRFNQEITLAIMEVEPENFTVKKIVIPHEAAK